MMPLVWRLGAGLGGLGAVMIAPYLAGVCILAVLGLPLTTLRFGLACAYWQALDLPAFAPYALRIRWAGGVGLALAPAVWLYGVVRLWRLARMRYPRPNGPPFLGPADWPHGGPGAPGQPVLTTHRLRRYHLPPGESLLLAAPAYGATHAVLKGAVRDNRGPLLVIDLDGAMHGATAGWRAAFGDVHRLAPFGGGRPWNPLAIAWTDWGLDRSALDALAACWYPQRDRTDRAHASHVRGMFRTLVTALDEVLRAAGESVPPAPGDLWRLLAVSGESLDSRVLTVLAHHPALTPATQDALREAAALDGDTLGRIGTRLRAPLEPFAGADLDAGTRGARRPLSSAGSTTVYLDVPYARRQDAVPWIEAFVTQWLDRVRDGRAVIVIHGLDLLPPLPCLQRTDGHFRCLASVRSLATLYDAYGRTAAALMHRFGMLAVQAPCDRALAVREATAIDRHAASRCGAFRPLYPRADANALLALRAGEQAVFAPSLSHAMRCRVMATRDIAPAPPVPAQGEPMPFPKPLAVLLASLVAGCSVPAQKVAAEPSPFRDCGLGNPDRDPEGSKIVCLGPYRFRLLSKLFNGHHQPSASRTELGFVLDWPTLEPLPYGFDMYKDNNRFLASLRINVSYLDRLSDEQYRVLPRRSIEPFNPSDPAQRADPADNLDLRIKGAPVHGLTPYYTDFDKLRRYYIEVYGPATRAAEPESSMNDDWYLDLGEDGLPRTVLKCSPQVIPDGVRLQNGRLVKIPGVFRRAGCSHEFFIPEYKAMVNLHYQRLMMPDWQRIETRIRRLLHEAEMDR
ncbi:hypothetical protein QFZ41_001008 [Luteibacter sp. W1I16]|uniref:hypothetical protein n=1 Tax=Luteibacter sp. W1I16 TaxID=3373922 RepID=UPI003D20B11A